MDGLQARERPQVARISASDGIHESRKSPFDRNNIRLIAQRCIYVTAEVCWHLRTRFANNQDVALSLQADKVAGLEYDIIARNCCFALVRINEVIVLCEQKDPANRARCGLFNLVQNSAARDKVRLPIQDLCAEAKQISLD